MAKPFIDISVVGDKELIKMLSNLEQKTQKKVVLGAMRKLTKQIKKEIVAAVPVDTGNLKQAMQKTKIKALKRSRSRSGIAYGLPTREDLGSSAQEKGYYPTAVEYGTNETPPRSFIRKPTDQLWESTGKEQLGSDIAKGIEKEAKKK